MAPIDLGDPFILYVGIRRTYKNFLRFLEAFGTSRLYEMHKLVCFGGGKLNPEELSSMQRRGIPRECVLQTEGDAAALARHYKAAADSSTPRSMKVSASRSLRLRNAIVP